MDSLPKLQGEHITMLSSAVLHSVTLCPIRVCPIWWLGRWFTPPFALRQRVEGTAELVAHDARHVVFEHLDADVPRLVDPRPALS